MWCKDAPTNLRLSTRNYILCRLESGASGQSGLARIWLFLSSLSFSFASLMRWAIRALPYFCSNSPSVSHFLAPLLRCRLLTRSSLVRLDSVQCPSHWIHCSYRMPSLALPWLESMRTPICVYVCIMIYIIHHNWSMVLKNYPCIFVGWYGPWILIKLILVAPASIILLVKEWVWIRDVSKCFFCFVVLPSHSASLNDQLSESPVVHLANNWAEDGLGIHGTKELKTSHLTSWITWTYKSFRLIRYKNPKLI